MSDSKAKIKLVLPFNRARLLLGILLRIKVKGANNVHKSRLQNYLNAQFDEFEKERIELIKSQGVLDDKGELIQENGEYKIKDQAAFEAAFKKLQEDLQFIVDGAGDDLKQGCLTVCRDLIMGDACPELSPEESMAFVQIIDDFQEVKIDKAE